MHSQASFEEIATVGEPSLAYSAEKQGAVEHGIHCDGCVVYGSELIISGWVIGDAELRVIGPDGELQRRMFFGFSERPDLRVGYKLEPGVRAKSFICIVRDYLGEKLTIAGYVESRTVVLTACAAFVIIDAAELSDFIVGHIDKSGTIFRAMCDSPEWVALLLPLLPLANESEKIARANMEDARIIPGFGGLVVGWAFASGRSELFIVTKQGWARRLSQACRWHRPDIVEAFSNDFGNSTLNAGFVAALPSTLQLADDIILVCANENFAYRLTSRKLEAITEDPLTFAKWSFALPTSINNFAEHYASLDGPILSRLIKGQSQRNLQIPPIDTFFGPVVTNPKCSIVVPLYGRYDFMFNQFLEFADDSFFTQFVELIYVVDDPRIADNVLRECPALYEYYGVPFRVINGGTNRGYSSANNLGVRFCTAENILLLNSDVIPIESGWLDKMITALDANENVGIVGARLRYPNQSLQHDGIAFQWHAPWGTYINKHPGMGMEPTAPSKTPVERVAVTGACMLLKRAIYDAVAGLDEEYLIGDFEDTDLCLKVRKLGKSIVCVQDVNLVHLERQSFVEQGSGSFRSRVTQYNSVRHQERWGSYIATLVGPALENN